MVKCLVPVRRCDTAWNRLQDLIRAKGLVSVSQPLQYRLELGLEINSLGLSPKIPLTFLL